MLKVERLSAYYGPACAVREVSFVVQPGQWVTVLGRNGSGRSTLLKALMGLVPTEGAVQWAGKALQAQAPHSRARAGLAYVPETRDVFPRLSVEHNLRLGQQGAARAPDWTLERVYDLFPVLAERRHQWGGVLSGGEQQLLCMARALLGQPQLLMVDEPTEGLSPYWTNEVGCLLRALQAQGVALLVVEQKRSAVWQRSDRVLLMGRGRLVLDVTPDEWTHHVAQQAEWLEG